MITAADATLGAAAEQHTVGHDGGDDAAGFVAVCGFEHCQHVLQEHQVGFLAASRGCSRSGSVRGGRATPWS